MSIPQMTEVRSVLKPYESGLSSCVQDAWHRWLSCDFRAESLYDRTSANVVYDAFAKRARQEFHGHPGVWIVDKKQCIHLLFEQRVLLRFKKQNAAGVGSSIETQSAMDFMDPEAPIPGLVPDIMKVELTYQLDDLQASLQEVAVVARNRGGRLWSYPIQSSAGAAVVHLHQGAQPAPQNLVLGNKPAVTLKGQAPKQDQADRD